MKVVRTANGLTPGKKVYECSTCGVLFNWDKNSSWYGSYKDMEEKPHLIKYYCSDKCCDK